MEIKKFDDYTEEEKRALLNHWWYYYGKQLISLDVVEKFNELLVDDLEFVKNVALIGYIMKKTSQDLIMAIKSGTIDELKDTVDKVVSSKEFLHIEEELEKAFLEEVVGTYNNPEPPVPFSKDQIISLLHEEVRGLVGPNCTVISVDLNDLMKQEAEMRGEYFLDSEDVYKIYKECLLKADKGEFVDDEPLVDFSIGEGIKCAAVFSTQRLVENKETIIEMIDALSEFESEVPFTTLCVDKNGRPWTCDYAVVDALVQLGMATETLSYLYDRSEWSSLPNQVPYIMRNREKDNSDVRGHDAKEFKKVIDEVKSGIYRRDAE